MRRLTLLAVPLCLFAVPAGAQTMVDVPIWGNGILGQQNLRNTYENTDRAIGVKPKRTSSASSGCSVDALPAADRKRMEVEFARRARTDGRASADAWVNEQGRRFHEKLVAEGVCPSPGKADRTAALGDGKAKRVVRDNKGKPCSKTRLENRLSPSLGGGAMTMGLTPVCAD